MKNLKSSGSPQDKKTKMSKSPKQMFQYRNMYSKPPVQTPDNCEVDDEKNDMLGKPILRHRNLFLVK